MDSMSLTQLLYCFCVLSGLLLVGALLRGVVPVFRKLFLPASVIGGFVGLLIGPILWGSHAPAPFPQEWITTWSNLPGILIVPVVASVPLGMKLGKQEGGAKKKTSSNVLKMFAIISGLTALQGVIGLLTQAFFNGAFQMDLYRTFGYELPSGFSGGHGTAGVIGNYFTMLELPYAQLAQGVTTTTATFGLVGGMIAGIFAINIAARKGKTAVLQKPGDIPADMAKGFQMDTAKQKSLGKETTYNSSIESLSFHLAVVLVGCGLAYALMRFVGFLGTVTAKVPVLSVIISSLGNIPIWAYAIVVMFGVNFLLHKLKLDSLIDPKTKSRIAGTCSDYAIIAAIASLPVAGILPYIVPILVMCVVGFATTFLLARFLCNRYFDDYQVERSMAIWGTSTGVFLTGLLLLKICDPDYESPVLNDYSVGFSLTSILSFVLMALFVQLLLTYSALVNAAIQLGFALVYFLIILFADRVSRRLSRAG